MQLDYNINFKTKIFQRYIINITKPIKQLKMMSCSVLLYPKKSKKGCNMSKESKCFDLKPKQKKHYEKWKKLIKNLSSNKPNETESEPKNNEKEKKTFEDYFPVSTITKCYVNRLDYEPILRA